MVNFSEIEREFADASQAISDSIKAETAKITSSIGHAAYVLKSRYQPTGMRDDLDVGGTLLKTMADKDVPSESHGFITRASGLDIKDLVQRGSKLGLDRVKEISPDTLAK